MRQVFLAAALLALCAPAAIAEDYTGGFERTLSVSGPVDLRVSTNSGGIKIRKGTADKVRIVARIRVSVGWWGLGGADPDVIREIEKNPPIRQTGSMIVIGNDVRRWERVGISYDIDVPEQTRVKATSGSGSVDTQDVHGPAELRTGSGGVVAERIGDRVEAQSGSGSVRVVRAAGSVLASSGSGGIEVSSANGDVEARTGSGSISVIGATGIVRIRTGSGGLRVERATKDVEAHSSSGTVRVDGAPRAARWNLSTSSGGIHVGLPREASFEIDARTGSGSVSTSHNVTTTGTMKRNELRGTAGRGDTKLYLRASSGSIRVD